MTKKKYYELLKEYQEEVKKKQFNDLYCDPFKLVEVRDELSKALKKNRTFIEKNIEYGLLKKEEVIPLLDSIYSMEKKIENYQEIDDYKSTYKNVRKYVVWGQCLFQIKWFLIIVVFFLIFILLQVYL